MNPTVYSIEDLKHPFDNCFLSKTVKINPKSIGSPYVTTTLISSIKEKTDLRN